MKNLIQRTLQTLAPLVLLSLAASQAAAQSSVQFNDQSGSKETGGDRDDPLPVVPAKCPNQGTKTVPAMLVEGPAICDTALGLSVTLPGGGGTVTAGGSGCPSYVEIIPSYEKAVIKPGYFISGSQRVYHQKATYSCVACGFLWLFTCCEESSPWAATRNYKTSFDEFPCAVIIQ